MNKRVYALVETVMGCSDIIGIYSTRELAEKALTREYEAQLNVELPACYGEKQVRGERVSSGFAYVLVGKDAVSLCIAEGDLDEKIG